MASENNIIALAADHAGYALKQKILNWLENNGYGVIDLGTHNEDSVDYPDYGKKMGECLESGEATRGIVVCGTGIGISVAVNRFPAARCVLCHDVTTARLSREHNDANVLALGARILGEEVVFDCIETFLKTGFLGEERHMRRVNKL
ncbi:MAG: ribose 5-phosphate isomerase B [Pseudomonadota bacterium]